MAMELPTDIYACLSDILPSQDFGSLLESMASAEIILDLHEKIFSPPATVTFETVPYEKLLPPIHRKFFPQEQADMLHTIYQKLYPLANFRPVSVAYLQSTRAVI